MIDQMCFGIGIYGALRGGCHEQWRGALVSDAALVEETSLGTSRSWISNIPLSPWMVGI